MTKIAKNTIEEMEAKMILDKVNTMVDRGCGLYEVQMYLFNHWVGKNNPDKIIDGYEK